MLSKGFALLTLSCLLFSSCEKDTSETNNTKDQINLNSLNFKTINSISRNVAETIESSYFMPITRNYPDENVVINEDSISNAIAESCIELVANGREIQDELIEIAIQDEEQAYITDEEIQILTNLTEDQLAQLALEITTLSEYDELLALDGRQISSNKYVQCMAEALGISDLLDMWQAVVGGPGGLTAIYKGTKIIINTKTLSKVLGGLALRSAGWISVGITLYKYATCINQN